MKHEIIFVTKEELEASGIDAGMNAENIVGRRVGDHFICLRTDGTRLPDPTNAPAWHFRANVRVLFSWGS